MGKRAVLAALVGLSTCALASAADAAVMVKTYQITALFTNAPIASVTQQFTLSFDPALTSVGNNVGLSGYTQDSALRSFDPVGGVIASSSYRSAASGVPALMMMYVFGAADGKVVNTGSYDFQTQFDVDRTGNLTTARLQPTVYFGSGTYQLFTSSSATITEVTAVPEPATWAMMIGGFALVGWRLRRRAVGGALRTA